MKNLLGLLALAMFAACVHHASAEPAQPQPVVMVPVAPMVALNGTGHEGEGRQACPPGDKCNFSCDGGNCAFGCTGGAHCDADCDGGNCTLECAGGATCNFECDGGNCITTCEPGSTCNIECDGGGCH
jgi:hypothetical protein